MDNNRSQPKLIILSDLWGRGKSPWLAFYVENLQQKYNILYHDCCELGGIDKTTYTELNLHHQFENRGIERAVESILASEKQEVDVLAFSMGAVIAWKAALKGLKIQNLFAVSATRLRYETEKPDCRIELFYGENDEYKPSTNWFLQMELESQLFAGEGHELYRKKKFAKMISEQILNP